MKSFMKKIMVFVSLWLLLLTFTGCGNEFALVSNLSEELKKVSEFSTTFDLQGVIDYDYGDVNSNFTVKGILDYDRVNNIINSSVKFIFGNSEPIQFDIILNDGYAYINSKILLDSAEKFFSTVDEDYINNDEALYQVYNLKDLLQNKKYIRYKLDLYYVNYFENNDVILEDISLLYDYLAKAYSDFKINGLNGGPSSFNFVLNNHNVADILSDFILYNYNNSELVRDYFVDYIKQSKIIVAEEYKLDAINFVNELLNSLKSYKVEELKQILEYIKDEFNNSIDNFNSSLTLKSLSNGFSYNTDLSVDSEYFRGDFKVNGNIKYSKSLNTAEIPKINDVIDYNDLFLVVNKPIETIEIVDIENSPSCNRTISKLVIDTNSKSQFSDYYKSKYISQYDDIRNETLLDVKIKMINDSTYLPLRVVAETLGTYIEWDEFSGNIYAYKNDGSKILVTGLLDSVENITYIKVRDFEKLGYIVDYDNGVVSIIAYL